MPRINMLSAAFTLNTFVSLPITGPKLTMQWWQIAFRFSLPPNSLKSTFIGIVLHDQSPPLIFLSKLFCSFLIYSPAEDTIATLHSNNGFLMFKPDLSLNDKCFSLST